MIHILLVIKAAFPHRLRLLALALLLSKLDWVVQVRIDEVRAEVSGLGRHKSLRCHSSLSRKDNTTSKHL